MMLRIPPVFLDWFPKGSRVLYGVGFCFGYTYFTIMY